MSSAIRQLDADQDRLPAEPRSQDGRDCTSSKPRLSGTSKSAISSRRPRTRSAITPMPSIGRNLNLFGNPRALPVPSTSGRPASTPPGNSISGPAPPTDRIIQRRSGSRRSRIPRCSLTLTADVATNYARSGRSSSDLCLLAAMSRSMRDRCGWPSAAEGWESDRPRCEAGQIQPCPDRILDSASGDQFTAGE